MAAARKFTAVRRVELGFAGVGWEQAYINIRVPAYGELKSVVSGGKLETAEDQMAEAEKMMAFVRDHFVDGKAPADGVLVDLEADDIELLPITVVSKVVASVTTQDVLSPNS